MRIDDLNVSANDASSRAGAVETTAVQLSGSKADRAGGVPAGGDSVELSGLSRIFQAFAAQRADHIESLSAEVRSGQYSIDPEALSRALVQETLAGGPAGSHA